MIEFLILPNATWESPIS